MLLLFLACSTPEAEPSDSTGFWTPFAEDTGSEEADTQAPEPDWVALGEAPFQTGPDTSEGLTNTSADLWEVLEQGQLEGACASYAVNRGDRQQELLCGKEMFFYETFGTAGVPTALVDFILSGFQDEVGEGFSAYGLIPDPTSEAGYPLGMSDQGNGVAFTCASCHFAQMADGRYAVGAPNHDYDYGGHNLALAVSLMAAMSGLTGTEIHPDARAEVQPMIDKLAWNPGLQWEMMGVLMQLLNEEQPVFSAENQGYYANWRSGTMDFVIQPLPADDGVHTISKISALWDIPHEGDTMLGWTGNTTSTLDFVRLFGIVGGDGEPWADEDLQPLVTYLESLTAPEAPHQPPASVDRGAALFATQGCLDCHAGPAGSGERLYESDEVGTDSAITLWMDPDDDGEACCGFEADMPITNRIKSPRLVGLWTMDRYLHNGSLDSLEQLFCMEDRPSLPSPWSAEGHTFGCELDVQDRRDLIAFLESH